MRWNARNMITGIMPIEAFKNTSKESFPGIHTQWMDRITEIFVKKYPLDDGTSN